MTSEQQELLQALVKTYRPIEELIPAYWREGDGIMVDARGHGRSDGIASGFSSALLVEDTAGVIRTLKLGRTRIIGLSQGGSTVLRLAATYPELVHSFIVAFDPYLTIVRAFLRGHSFHHQTDTIAHTDVVVNATGDHSADVHTFFVHSTKALIEGVQRAGGRRLIVVGGAGTPT